MDAAEVVPHEVERDGRLMVLAFLYKTLVSRVNRRMGIRMVRFWRSTCDVEMWPGSGLPMIAVLRPPCHEEGAAPVGFMVCGPAAADGRILAVAAAVERVLRG
jgi:Asp-tRNA(Asn)/Glu-tRNA(Gln) amidotransferase A subunit family amidase